MKFGSVCSGIEAASVAFKPLGMTPLWFSEISDFPSSVLKHHYPEIPNYGDMNNLPELIREGEMEAPDLLCGGTPCQAFSLAGWQKGLVDSRGQLTLKFIEIADAIDDVRLENGKDRSIVLWENVEGVLNDKTNAFGIFIAGLAGLEEEINVKRWETSGVLIGPKRNIAWRVLDAKFFGLPQQRKRLFVIATDTNINPEMILFEKHDDAEAHNNLNNLNKIYNKSSETSKSPEYSLFSDENPIPLNNNQVEYIKEHKFEIFREYTDCLYSAYGTKWNGNAAAYNGSLYLSHNDRVRRLTPLECERLMGFPDNYTLIPKAKNTNRYQAVGNSWAIPVVQWIGERIFNHKKLIEGDSWLKFFCPSSKGDNYQLYLIDKNTISLNNNHFVNVSSAPNNIEKGYLFDMIDIDPDEKLFLSEQGMLGILRRKQKRNINMNQQLENIFLKNVKNCNDRYATLL